MLTALSVPSPPVLLGETVAEQRVSSAAAERDSCKRENFTALAGVTPWK